MTGFFQKLSHQGGLTDWQFRQAVEAVELLLQDLADALAAARVDWAWWKEGSRGLPPEHPTLARDLPLASEAAAPGAAVDASTDADALLAILARKLRARQHSICTERSYVAWCRRFLQFCGERHGQDVSPADIERFLDHLAVERKVTASANSGSQHKLGVRSIRVTSCAPTQDLPPNSPLAEASSGSTSALPA